MLRDLITLKPPPVNRTAKTDSSVERHFTEAAVMLAYAFHLFDVDSSLERVELHPDGEHGKQFDIRSWLELQGFNFVKPEGSTSYGGVYSSGKRFIHVSLRPGLGDVVAETDVYRIVAECKGGIINTKHPGQKSRLRKGLCEAVGLLMSRPLGREKHFAVVPLTHDTETVAKRMRNRCADAGIGICLVGDSGVVTEVDVEQHNTSDACKRVRMIVNVLATSSLPSSAPKPAQAAIPQAQNKRWSSSAWRATAHRW